MTDRPWSSRSTEEQKAKTAELNPSLKPCPFCGSSAVELEMTDEWPMDFTWIVVCRGDCNSGMYFCTDEPEWAVAMWNRRGVEG